MLRRCLVALVLLGLLGAAPAAARTGAGRLRCQGDPNRVHRLEVTVEGTRTRGLFAVPRGRPKGLVAFTHGYGHTADSWREHLRRVAREDGVIAFAMDYRGTRVEPDGTVRGWQVQEGAEDTVQVAKQFERDCRPNTIVLYGVSMGGNTSGLALAMQAKRAGGTTPLFDWWVAVEGAANVIETYHEARLVAPSGNAYAVRAVEDIERQMGGPFGPDTAAAYQERTVVARVEDIRDAGVKGVVIVHGLADGLVPYDQSRELAEALRAAQVPVHFFTVTTRGNGEPGTTIDGYAGLPEPYESPFAGHASEDSTTHVVGNTGFARLRAIWADDVPDENREEVVVPNPAVATR